MTLPNLLPARKRGSESAAIGAVKGIANAQTLYREGDKNQDGRLDYAVDLLDLINTGPRGDENLIDEVLASGQKQGYTFRMGSPFPDEFWVKASPTPGSDCVRHFYVDETGAIYFSRRDFEVPILSYAEAGLRRLGE